MSLGGSGVEARGVRLWVMFMLVALAASGFVTLVPSVAHATITGTPTLAYASGESGTPTIHDAAGRVGVIAGTPYVVNADTLATPQPAYFAIDTSTITNYAGANIYLFLSTNGNAMVSNAEGDVFYAGKFPALQLASSTLKGYAADGAPDSNGPYFVGQNVIIGPIPAKENSSYQYVKLYDGSCGAPKRSASFICAGTGIAGSKQLLLIAPGIAVTPGSGSAGQSVTVTGGGFRPGMEVDINATYMTAPWVGSNKSHNVLWAKGIPTESGNFSVTGPMLDTRQVINPKSTGPYVAVNIVLSAVDAASTATVLNAGQESLAPPAFKEFSRGIASVLSYGPSGKAVDLTDGAFAPDHLYGNDSGVTGSVGPITVRDIGAVIVEACGTLQVSGNFSYVGKPVTFQVETTPGTVENMSTASTVIPDASGSWEATVNVPLLSEGPHTVLVENGGVRYGISDTGSSAFTTTVSSSACAATTTTTTAASSVSTSGTTVSSSTTTVAHSSSTISTVPSSVSSSTTTQASTTSAATSTPGPTTTSSGIPEFPYGSAAAVLLMVGVLAGYLVVRRRLRASVRAGNTEQSATWGK